MTETEPPWLAAWHAGRVSTDEAISRFDSRPGLEPANLVGLWRGQSLPTGHPLDGLLEALGWYGKAIQSPDHVHPLLFSSPSGRVRPLDPSLMPTAVALRWPGFARSLAVRLVFAAAGPILQASRPGARLTLRDFRGKRSAAIIYKRQPIIDHLRSLDANRVIGLMERKGMDRPFFFLLTREAEHRPFIRTRPGPEQPA